MLKMLTGPVTVTKFEQMSNKDGPFKYKDGSPVMGLSFRCEGEEAPRLLKVDQHAQLDSSLFAGAEVCLVVVSDDVPDARIGADGSPYVIRKTKYSVVNAVAAKSAILHGEADSLLAPVTIEGPMHGVAA